jgi:transposase-like protein
MLSLAERYVQGVSTRKVTKIVEELCGHSVSSTQVSAAAAKLDAELQSCRDRPLGSCSYMILDARYEKVRQGAQLLDCAVLIAIGIGPDGKRTVLGVSAALSEAEVHWRNFLASLQSWGASPSSLSRSPTSAACAQAMPLSALTRNSSAGPASLPSSRVRVQDIGNGSGSRHR